MPSGEAERVLLEAARLFASSLELDATIAQVAQLGVPRLADWCLVDLVTDDGKHFERVAVGHQGGTELAHALGRRYPLMSGRPGVAAAMVTGKPQLVAFMDDAVLDRIAVDDEHVSMLRASGVRSCIAAPMIAGGRTIGSLAFGSNQRTYSNEEIWLVEQLALIAASAITNARLYEAERWARVRAGRLQHVVAALSRASTIDEVAEATCRIAGEAVDALSCAVWLTHSGGPLRLVGTWRLPETFVRQFQVLQRGTPGVPAVEALDTGAPVWIESPEEFRLRAPALYERSREIGRLASFAMLPLDIAGRLVGVVGFAHARDHRYDTDERTFCGAVAQHCAHALERAELLDQARRAEQRVRLALDAGAIGTWDYDPIADRATWDERALQIVGITDDVPISRARVVGLAHPDDVGALDEAARRALDPKGPGELSFEHRIILRDGTLRWVSLRGRVQFDGGLPVRFLGTVVDTTEAHAAEAERAALLARERAARAEAEAANRLKDEFLATVSHELRTPLHAIAGWSERLARKLDDRATLSRGLDVIHRNVEMQARMVDDILDVSRIAAGTLRVEPAAMDLAAVVRDAIEVVRPECAIKGLQLSLYLAERVPITGDAQRLQQAIGNVLANAVKFTDPGGEIMVALSFEVDTASVVVTDTGRGIAPEFLPHVFDRFRQGDSSSTRRFGGLGLGLAIARHLVELHGGRVQAESGGIGRGARFTLEVPVFATMIGSAPGAPRTRADLDEPLADIAGCRILLVDDERDARELLREVLVELGAVVRTAGSAREAIEVFVGFRPDVVVSDIRMPGEDGYALMRQLRELSADPIPYTIALTADARDQERERSLTAGFDAHVSKPVELQTLAAAIAAGHAGRRTARSLGS